jgi:hypothetical protein
MHAIMLALPVWGCSCARLYRIIRGIYLLGAWAKTPMIGHCLHATLAYQASMVLQMVSPVQTAISANEPIGLVQHRQGHRAFQGFCDLEIQGAN